MLVFIALFISIAFPKPTRAKAIFRGVTLVAILITGIVFNFVWDSYRYGFHVNITHLVIPLGFLLDWLVFDKRGFMKWHDIAILLIYPFAYGVLSVLAGSLRGFAIYGFFDLSAGVGAVLIQLIFLLVLITVVCTFVVSFDKIFVKFIK